MPRIDPSQLLRTLSQLLSQEGGIKSAEEVPRIVKLMQKFSKKLVSKCIYIHILRASEMDLLELFLQQKGWDLLNLWFLDSINSGNWHLCGDLVKLFAVCPMNSNRLKENVEVNQAPKLIRQLSIDTRLEADIRNQAQQVLQQWMSVIRAPAQPVPQPQARAVERVEAAPASPTDAGAQAGSDEDWSPSHGKPRRVLALGKKTKGNSSPNDSSVDVDDLLGDSPSTSEDEDEETSVIRKKKEEIEKRRKEREDKKAKEEEREKKRAQERKDKSRLGYTKTEFGNRGAVDSQEKERIREVARKLKEESDAKSKSKSADYEANRGSKMTAGLARIPKIPKKEPVEEAKKPPGKNLALGFGDLLGGMDVQKPKTIIKNKNRDLMEDLLNTSPIKTSNVRKEEKKKSSTESRMKEDRGRKESSEARARDKEDRHKAKEERRSSLTGKDDKERSSREEKDKERSSREEKDKEKSIKDEKDKERSSKDKSREKERNGQKERTKPSLTIPERRKEASSPVTTPEVAKSPKVIKDSGFLGDVLGDIMKEPPKKRKRRLSEVRAEREAKEADKEAKEEAERAKRRKEDDEKKSGSGSEEEERTMEVENGLEGEELPFAEPTCDLPREVRGILVVARGSKRKGRLSWRPDAALVETHYFEMDDNERANVWKLKSFDEMRKQEAMKEKEVQVAGHQGHQAAGEDEDVGSSKEWRVAPIAFIDPKTKEQVSRIWECYGRDSQEKEVQQEREGRVLKSLFFAALPTDPTEPDPQDRGTDRTDTRSIPGEDQSGEAGEGGDSLVDHSMRGWPDPKDLGASTPPPTANLPTNLSQLLQDPKMNLLQSILGSGQLSAPPPSLNPEETELFQAQAAAAAALVSRGDFNTPPPMAPPPNQHFNQQGYDRPPPEGFPMDRPPPGYPGPPRAGHNNFNKHRSQSEGRGGVWGREEGRGGFRPNYRRDGRREDRREGREYKRPCKFWMEKGRCHEEDRCKFPHPMTAPSR